MPNYRRLYVPGGTYFFTLVTHQRRPLFAADINRQLLAEVIKKTQAKRPYTEFAWVWLPDHIHWIWTLPPGDSNYSLRIAQIKETFTRRFLQSGGQEGATTANRLSHRERAVWQQRFWEHTVRDEDDLIHAVEYVHWNPVKHGYVKRAIDWPWSSFARFVEMGFYPANWGDTDPCPDFDSAEWDR
jgi:putative transposase